MEGWINVKTSNGILRLNLGACEQISFDGENLHLRMASHTVHFVALNDAKQIIDVIGGLPDQMESPGLLG